MRRSTRCVRSPVVWRCARKKNMPIAPRLHALAVAPRAQMVQFIHQEAREKAAEIKLKTDEEFNIEKLRMVEAEKQKIRAEYERKEKQVEVTKRMCVLRTAARERARATLDDYVCVCRGACALTL